MCMGMISFSPPVDIFAGRKQKFVRGRFGRRRKISPPTSLFFGPRGLLPLRRGGVTSMDPIPFGFCAGSR